MSTPTKKPGALMQIAAGLLILAAITGYYLLNGDPRKAATPEPAAQGQSAPKGITRALATGPLAAFLVKAERKPVPEISFQDGDGKPLTLASFKGRVVLLNLWATWCAPCRKEMPDLAALEKALGSDQFEVVAVSVDRKGVEVSSAFLTETGADNLKLYVEPSTEIVNKLQAIGLPVTLLIDRSGHEIGRLIGPADWSSPEAQTLIKAALAEPAT